MMKTQPDETRLLSVEEVARRLNVSPRTVKRRILEGELAAHKIGPQWRIAMRDVESYLRRHRFGGDRGVL